jgi:hypothetical protein
VPDRTKRWRPKRSDIARAITIVVDFEKPGSEGAYVALVRDSLKELKERGVPILGWSEGAVCRTCHGRGKVVDPEKGTGDLWMSKTCPTCRGAGRPERPFPEDTGEGATP